MVRFEPWPHCSYSMNLPEIIKEDKIKNNVLFNKVSFKNSKKKEAFSFKFNIQNNFFIAILLLENSNRL